MQVPTEENQAETPGTQTGASIDEGVFLSLINSHQRLLLKVCWTYTYSSHDRDDLFQEIVARLWSTFKKYDRKRRFSTWMYRLALNVAIDFRRRRKRSETLKSLEETREQASPEDAFKNELSQQLRELMEMKMNNINEHEDSVVDLGVASVETKGAALDDSDNIGGQVRQLGIADD